MRVASDTSIDLRLTQSINTTHSLSRVPGLPGDFAATKKLQEWCVRAPSKHWVARPGSRTTTTHIPPFPSLIITHNTHRLVTLNGMRAMDAISEEQARQLLFDLDQGYSAFHAWLKSHS